MSIVDNRIIDTRNLSIRLKKSVISNHEIQSDQPLKHSVQIEDPVRSQVIPLSIGISHHRNFELVMRKRNIKQKDKMSIAR